jgi:hypothetical protein
MSFKMSRALTPWAKSDDGPPGIFPFDSAIGPSAFPVALSVHQATASRVVAQGSLRPHPCPRCVVLGGLGSVVMFGALLVLGGYVRGSVRARWLCSAMFGAPVRLARLSPCSSAKQQRYRGLRSTSRDITAYPRPGGPHGSTWFSAGSLSASFVRIHLSRLSLS